MEELLGPLVGHYIAPGLGTPCIQNFSVRNKREGEIISKYIDSFTFIVAQDLKINCLG